MVDTADLFAPPPKRRRRTEKRAPATISPEQMVQTNATLSHFTGQRQNRWMQGYVPDGCNTTAASSRISNQQTGPAAKTPADEMRSLSENMADRMANGSVANKAEASASLRPAVSRSYVEGATEGTRRGNGVTVDYESPFTISAGSSFSSNTRNHMDRSMSVQNPGLPSPAPSDENNSSPMEPPKRGPGRPRTQPSWTIPSNGQFTNFAQMPPQPVQPRRAGSVGNAAMQSNNPRNANSQSPYQQPLAANGQGHGHGHGSPLTAEPSTARTTYQITQRDLNPNALKDRIEQFDGAYIATNHLADVDKGRLALLRDAVYPNVDWFYLVLSQLHALKDFQPGSLPDSIRALPPHCWRSLDDLVCSNKVVTPGLLKWLANYPMPIYAMYSDMAMSHLYNQHVKAVANFLRNLPANWDALVTHCRQKVAPPLVQDLVESLMLTSGVLQTVAFRAIGRMIYNGNEGPIHDQAEHLHRLDQQQYGIGLRRQPFDKNVAYGAFHHMRTGWAQWLQMFRKHEASQRTLPPMSRTRFPDFSVGWIAPSALAVFQPPQQRPAFPLPSNEFTPQQQNMPALQQQQGMVIDGQQRAARPPRVNVHSPSPANGMMVRSRQANTLNYMPVQQHPQGSRFLLLPHELDGPRSQPAEPNPVRSALHEAHLRSPIPVPLQISGEMPQLYRYVGGYALPPTRINKDMPVSFMTFNLPQDQFDKIPKTISSRNPGELPNQTLSQSSRTYRLRCCNVPPKGFLAEDDWILSDIHWPADLYLELNGNMLEPRRPLHHKKYLPIDLVKFIKPGPNEIKVSIARVHNDNRAFDFALAVETVAVTSHSTLIGRLENEQSISAANAADAIKQSLSGGGGGASDDDDDFAIVSTSMTIKLFDPFSGSKIFDTPVRGANCKHKDCFDLEVFLSQCKRDKPGAPTAVDCWRCPLCRGDVRPSMLVRDEWLVEVRQTLEAQSKLDTRAIVVEADGSWKAKTEEWPAPKRARSGEGKPVAQQQQARRVMEVVELD